MQASLEGSRMVWPWIVLFSVALVVNIAACSAPGTVPSSAAPPAATSSETPASSPSESSSGGGRGDYDYPDPAPASSPEASVQSAPGTAIEITVATGPAGTYLTGSNGLTLYTFKPDSANTSTCDGGCAEAWPPFTVESDASLEAGAGIDGELTTFARADGTLQVAYDGAPLYYFANDTSPGDTNGEGLGDNWFVARP